VKAAAEVRPSVQTELRAACCTSSSPSTSSVAQGIAIPRYSRYGFRGWDVPSFVDYAQPGCSREENSTSEQTRGAVAPLFDRKWLQTFCPRVEVRRRPTSSSPSYVRTTWERCGPCCRSSRNLVIAPPARVGRVVRMCPAPTTVYNGITKRVQSKRGGASCLSPTARPTDWATRAADLFTGLQTDKTQQVTFTELDRRISRSRAKKDRPRGHGR